MSSTVSHERMEAEGVRTICDPHHDGFSSWAYWNRKFWHRSGITGCWTEVKKIHPTAQRIQCLALLVEEADE